MRGERVAKEVGYRARGRKNISRERAILKGDHGGNCLTSGEGLDNLVNMCNRSRVSDGGSEGSEVLASGLAEGPAALSISCFVSKEVGRGGMTSVSTIETLFG